MSTGAVRKQTVHPNSSDEALQGNEPAFKLRAKPKLMSIPENLDIRIRVRNSRHDFGDGCKRADGQPPKIAEYGEDSDNDCSVIFVGSICSIRTYQDIKGVAEA